MAYWKPISKNSRTLDSFSLATSRNSGNGSVPTEFYEMELGVVLDIVLDETHPIMNNGEKLHYGIDSDRWPADLSGNPAASGDKDFSWIGRALVRPLVSERLTNKDQLVWAYPLENNISEYPLINETVVLTIQGEKLYYSRKVNCHNWPNNALDFSLNSNSSGVQNTEMFTTNPLTGKKESVLKAVTKDILSKDTGYRGYAGKYFVANKNIRAIKRYEGDLAIESRHGQTIHLTAYDSNRANDSGVPNSRDYIDGGNPMILIRNRQRSLLREGQTLSLHNSPNPATITGTKAEKNVGGYLKEDINHDGSSIHITSGQTISGWVTTCYKKMFGMGEEVAKFDGKSTFKYPILDGDQLVVNTDRIVLSARYNEMMQFSKKRFAIVTDNEYTIDAHQQIVLTTNTKTVINSPAIYLGEHDMTNEPVLLGQTTINWMYELCNWLLAHTHWYKHSHVDAGKESPSQTQTPVQVQQLIALRDKLHTLMSRRVFVTGGGLANGQNGGTITDGTDPTKINIGSGAGVPGGWKGKNYRPSVNSVNSDINKTTKGAGAEALIKKVP